MGQYYPMDQPETNKPETKHATFRAACLTHYGDPWLSLPNKIQYLAFAKEKCPTTDRIHYQTWAYADKPMRLTQWKKIFPGDHIEQMRGTFADNDKYCSKESEMTTFGVRPMGNGKKRSLELLANDVLEAAKKAKPLDLVVTDPDAAPTYVQYCNGIEKLYSMQVTRTLRERPPEMCEVYHVWGPPGSGKTRWVREKEPDVYNVPASDGYKWKNGYCGQEAVLYDNVRASAIRDPAQLLVEIDRYYIQVPTKGGFVGWKPKRVYITCLESPWSFAHSVKFDDVREYIRRVKWIVELTDGDAKIDERWTI